jgi:uncharacterized RDD family membrane protein YckC
MSHDAVSSAAQPSPYPTPLPYGGSPVLFAPQTAPAPLAGWWRRVGAYLLDYLVALVPYLLGTAVGLALLREVPDPAGGTYDEFTPGTGIAFALGLLGTLAVIVWNRYLRQGRTGQSLGKRALGIRLVSARDAQPLGAGMAFGRDIAHFLDGIVYIGWLWPLWDRLNQTFADKVAGSVVVLDR